MKIETLENVEIKKIKPYLKNYQSHELNKEHIKNSIEDFNFDVPIVVDHNYIIVKGHGRYEALLDLGHKTIPLVIVNHTLDTPEKAAAARIADNESSRAAQIDNDILKGELLDIGDFFDMGDYGLNMDLMGDDEEDETTGDNEVPESVPSITVKGDLYELGEHRLLCGDSTMIDDVEKLMDGEKADMVFTDPPYGINMAKGFEGSTGFGGVGKPIKRKKYDNDQWDDKRPDHNCFELIMRYGKDSIIFGGNFFADILPQSKHWLVWDKNNTMPPFGDCELAWTSINRNSVKKYDYTYNGLIGKETERFHPTQKPIGLFLKIFNDYDFKFCFDPFLGSGSTLIACEKTKRKCYGMELDEKYCDVIVKRYVDFCKTNNKKYSVKRNGAICSEFDD